MSTGSEKEYVRSHPDIREVALDDGAFENVGGSGDRHCCCLRKKCSKWRGSLRAFTIVYVADLHHSCPSAAPRPSRHQKIL